MSYTSYTGDPTGVLVDRVWSLTSCCMVYKNGSVMHDFKPTIPSPKPMSANTTLDFGIKCYLNDTFTGNSLSYPAYVTKGQSVYCRIFTDTWDERLYLVVPDCKFTGTATGPPTFAFLDQK